MTKSTNSFIDLSHIVEDGMVTYKGLPAPIICDFLTREASREIYTEGTEFQIGRIEMVSNTGTYIDVPFHRYADGEDLSEVGLERLVDLPAIVVRIAESELPAVDVRHLPAPHIISGSAILVHTGWSRNWRTDEYFEDYPYLTGDAASYLVEHGAALVGIDSFNIDAWEDKSRPVHTRVLAAGIPIIEHMTNLDVVPEQGGATLRGSSQVQGRRHLPCSRVCADSRLTQATNWTPSRIIEGKQWSGHGTTLHEPVY